MATLLIDIRDVTATPVVGDTVTLTAPAPRPSTSGGVTRPFDRLVALDDAGRATVEVEPGPLRVSFHDAYERDVVLDVTVPAGGDTFTLRELAIVEIGTVEDVPGIRDALDAKADKSHRHTIDDVDDLDKTLEDLDMLVAEKADGVHTHHVYDVDGLEDALDDKADATHTHHLYDVDGLEDALDAKADKSHRHTIDDVDDLKWSLDQKVSVDGLEQTVYDFAAIRIAEIVDGAPESLDTLREVADALANQDDSLKALFQAIGERAMKIHRHTIADVDELQSTLDSKASEQELTSGLAGKANKVHRHEIGSIYELQTALDAKANKAHKHNVADVNGLQSTLDSKASTQALTSGLTGKADKAHKHASSDIRDAVTAADGKTAGVVVKTYSDGFLHSVAEPTLPNHVTNKRWVDAQLAEKEDSNFARLSGPGWTAHRRCGVVTVHCNAMNPETTFTFPAGWRPFESAIFPVVAGAVDAGQWPPALEIKSSGEMSVLRTTSNVYTVATYLAKEA